MQLIFSFRYSPTSTTFVDVYFGLIISALLSLLFVCRRRRFLSIECPVPIHLRSISLWPLPVAFAVQFIPANNHISTREQDASHAASMSSLINLARATPNGHGTYGILRMPSQGIFSLISVPIETRILVRTRASNLTRPESLAGQDAVILECQRIMLRSAQSRRQAMTTISIHVNCEILLDILIEVILDRLLYYIRALAIMFFLINHLLVYLLST